MDMELNNNLQLIPNDRQHIIDMMLNHNINDLQNEYKNKLLVRFVAKNIEFRNIAFHYTIFDNCYFRQCKFIDCNFTGCKFIDSNFYGATFSGCEFQYSNFDKTIIDPSILDTNCPSMPNLKLRFARSLKKNYQEIGDSQAINKAIRIELDANQEFLKKAWSSNESYYNRKYTTFQKFSKFFEYCFFIFMDFVWGNGEKPFKILTSILLFIIITCLLDIFLFSNSIAQFTLATLWDKIKISTLLFVGVKKEDYFPMYYLSIVELARYLFLGLSLAVILKKWSWR